MKDCYTACDRSLLKELMRTLEPVIIKVVMQGKPVPLSFYLSVFEKEIEMPQTLSAFYKLKELSLFKPNELLNYGIEDAFEKARVLELQKLSEVER
jgi:hypothetical protein